ncbi:MAG: hypothetical protein KGI72_05955 [Patescibacteria group bacterium]|nr:hypothetical protein [Patescibacteria group bacterium]
MAVHRRLIAGESWIAEGNYHKTLDERLNRATLVIFLNVSRLIAVPRVLRRARRGGQPADAIPDGARAEQISWGFLKWMVSYNRRKRIRSVRLLCAEKEVPLLVLHPAPIKRWIELVASAVRDAQERVR